MHTPRRGFSLLEIIVVITIVGTLAAIAAPRYGASLARYRADSAAKQVQASLTYARERAKSASADRTVVFDPSSITYEILGETSLDRDGGPYTVDLKASPFEIREMDVQFGDDTSVTFDMYGRPDSDGWVLVRVGDVLRYVWVDEAHGRATLP